MSIKQWPANQRPREKLIEHGAHSLSDAELLAIFLRTGIPGLNAVGLSQSILAHFGSLSALFAADQDQFCEHAGLGPAKFVQLQAVLEMGRRVLASDLKTLPALSSPAQTKAFLQMRMQTLQNEQFAAIWLDSQNQVLTFEVLFQGTLASAAVYPREVVKQALLKNAASVIFAHNHPSGVAEPSQADKIITDRLVKALDTVDIRVLDHMIIGKGDVTSFSERGLI